MIHINRWCCVCGYYFSADKSKHKCNPNFYSCRYIFTSYGTNIVKPLFFCIFCHRFNLSCQKVLCSKRNHKLEPEFVKAFSCNQFSVCRLHKEPSAICLSNPGVNKLKIYTYFPHDRNNLTQNSEYCKQCKRNPEPFSLFCEHNYVTIPVRLYIKQYLLKDGYQFCTAPILSTAVKKKELSVSFYSLNVCVWNY